MDADLLASMHSMDVNTTKHNPRRPPDLELQLLTKSTNPGGVDISHNSNNFDEEHSSQLQLSIGSSEFEDKIAADKTNMLNCRTPVMRYSPRGSCSIGEKPSMLVPQTPRLKEQAQEQQRIATAEKSYAEEARKQAKQQIELAEQEFRIRQPAEMEKAQALKDHVTKQINATMLQSHAILASRNSRRI